MTPQRFVLRKPLYTYALRWEPDHLETVEAALGWLKSEGTPHQLQGSQLHVGTIMGPVTLDPGDWLVHNEGVGFGGARDTAFWDTFEEDE